MTDDDELQHIGIPRRSGRYPWGSGNDPYQRNMSFSARVRELEKKGLDSKSIATAMGLKSIEDLRSKITVEKDREWLADSSFALRLLPFCFNDL